MILALMGMAAAASCTAKPTVFAPVPGRGDDAASAELPYDSNRQMYKVFPGFGPTDPNTFAALDEVLDQRDVSMIPVLVETMRFQTSARTREATLETLRGLTGLRFEGQPWLEWSNWLIENRVAFPPPSDYLNWKIEVMSQIDPRFVPFLRPALDGLIDVDPFELVWGGVIPDGIPDLRDPKMISPADATYLGSDERVFGLSVNGDHRAYPLRIANAHEMINDTVGGEPLSLSW